MGNPFETIKSPESSKEKAERFEKEEKEYFAELKKLANEKQNELDQLLALSEEQQDLARISTLTEELREINDQITMFEEFGDDFEIEFEGSE
ncbi:hypothetical protein MYX06_02040 [Patescibacteria group bacterium AH-259-L05]|nr:hypothetical protein [Patescibacteria group bacterium AH-259-L05]